MDNDHGITGELREWFKDRIFMANGWQELHDIADRIDAEHEAKVSYWQSASYKDGYDEGFASADDWLGQHEDAMAEHGWVRLPKDADGKPIHVGDVMEWCDSGETLTVDGIGSDVLFYIDGENAEWTAARNKRHHHEPTVEDVLREMIDEWVMADSTEDEEAVIAECAKKMQLRGDEQ